MDETKSVEEEEDDEILSPTLDSTRILRTARKLEMRMQERFPNRGLTKVVAEVCLSCQEAAAVSSWLKRPMWAYRLISGSIIFAVFVILVIGVAQLNPSVDGMGFAELVQTVEAGVNDVIFIALAIFFLVRYERRLKRDRALKMIHKLRSLAHIVDMHQLTKDPDSIAKHAERTSASPVRDLTPYQLKRYFDYCSEMLSLIGKQAALLVQHFDDPVTLSAVNEVETLTTGLSRKLWQKIMLTSQEMNNN